MDNALFDDLVQSLKEANSIAKGETEPARRFVVKRLDVKAIRAKTGYTQKAFAELLQISTKTLQNWEQYRRYPTGPAIALLKIISVSPEFAIQTLKAA